jgi:imidazolonepropionase-like amidohydrolase
VLKDVFMTRLQGAGFKVVPVLLVLMAVLGKSQVLPTVGGVGGPVAVAIVGGQVIDGTARAPIPDGVVLVNGDKVQAVGPRSAVTLPKGAAIVDAGGGTILPGLVDAHTHAAYFDADARSFEDDALSGLRAAAILRQALDHGITLMRDLGARHNVAIALKHALKSGYIEGPRLVVCNQIVGETGAHAAEFEVMVPPESRKWILESDGEDEWRRHIRHNVFIGADFIKVTGPFTAAEISLAAAEAHRLGKLLAVHAGGIHDDDMMMVEYAVKARADIIEHLYPMKNETQVINMMREQGTVVVPTVANFRRFSQNAQVGLDDPRIVPMLGNWSNPTPEDARRQLTPPDFKHRFERFHQSGIEMAIGTDVGGKHQDRIADFYNEELKLFLDWGYSPQETIQAATRVGAAAAGLRGVVGTLEAGKLADIIVVPGDPLKDINVVTRPTVVMLGGKVVRQKPIPSAGARP